MKKAILFIGLATLICSCSAQKATSYSYSEYKTISPTQSVYTVPLVADLVVAKDKITYAERINKDITTMSDGEVAALAKQEKETVMANALKAHNADVFVAPMVNITTDVNNNLVIVISGYPATYKNFRSATEKDKWIIEQAGQEQSPVEKEPSTPFGNILKK